MFAFKKSFIASFLLNETQYMIWIIHLKIAVSRTSLIFQKRFQDFVSS